MTAEEYLSALKALLPSGPAWPREEETPLTRLLKAWAEEFARLDARAALLTEEADARTTLELLPDWERALGLPECGLEYTTVEERRSALEAKLTAGGAMTNAELIALAEVLGFTITITEYAPFVAGSEAGDALWNSDWAFTKEINAPAETIEVFTAGWFAGEPLRDWGREALLECAMLRQSPAHVLVNFAYGA